MPDFTCKFCGGAYEVPEENVGDSIDCPSCEREIVAGDVIGGSSESGTSAAARILEERHAGKKSRPGYTMPMTWVTPLLVGIVSGVVIHLLVAIVSLKIKPFSDIIVYWVPIVFGVSTGLGAFMQSARVGVSTVPVWVTLLGILVIVPGAYLPIDVLKDQYHRRARNKLAAAVNAVTRPPYLPATTPQCISVRIGEVTKIPERKVRAFLESDEVFDLTADVNLASGKLVGGITKMQRALGAKAAAGALAAMLDRYEAFKDLRHERFELTRVKRAGRYLGEIVFPESVTFDLEVLVGSQVTCSLAAKSHIRASAMPHIERLWARYDPTFHGTCRDVELFKPIDARHLAAQATMTDGKTVPIILEVSNVKDPKAEVRVLFRFREAAVMKINESLYELDAEGRRTSIERCVDVDHRKELRAGEYSARALFPESDAKRILVIEDGYEVDVRALPYHVLRQGKKSSPKDGWSLLVPRDYQLGRREEFLSTCASDSDAMRLTLETRNVNDYAGFNLKSYSRRERKKWAGTHEDAPPRPMGVFTTASGVKGFHYVVAKDRRFRGKWFFFRSPDLAIITISTTKAQGKTEQNARGLVTSLRYKDQRTSASDSD